MRKLVAPPRDLADEIIKMGKQTLQFIQANMNGIRDLRAIFLRAVEMIRTLIEVVDKKRVDQFVPFAGAALNVRRRCCYCTAILPDPEDVEDYPDPDPDVGFEDEVEENTPTVCSLCKDLRYCSLGCQVADQRRHS